MECAIVNTKEMVAFGVADIERVCRESACAMDYANLRNRQLRVVTNSSGIASAVSPTGYSKSLCYALLPSATAGQRSIVVIHHHNK